MFAELKPDILSQKITKLFENAGDDAYQLSMPLLAAAYSKRVVLYAKIRLKMREALEILPNNAVDISNSRFAWMLGRLLLAETIIGERDYVVDIRVSLQAYLASKRLSQTGRDNAAFSAWAQSYLALHYAMLWLGDKNRGACPEQSYTEAKKSLKWEIANLSRYVLPTDSDMLWANVVAIAAAGHANDRQYYDELFKEIQGNTTSFSDGLMKIPADDFRLWAFACVADASKAMGDKVTFHELSKQLSGLQALAADKTTSDYVLSEVIMNHISSSTLEKALEEDQSMQFSQ